MSTSSSRTRDLFLPGVCTSTDIPPPAISIASSTSTPFILSTHEAHFRCFPSPLGPQLEPVLEPIPATPSPPSLRDFPLTTSLMGPVSPIAVFLSPTPPPSLPTSSARRRGSTTSDGGERRPKKGDDDYIKRPENAFILFRNMKYKELRAAQEDNGPSGPVKKLRQADFSKAISKQWRHLSVEERQHWKDLGKEKSKEHRTMYPNYIFCPQRSRDKASEKRKNRSGCEHTTSTDRVLHHLPVSPSPLWRNLSRDFVQRNLHGAHDNPVTTLTASSSTASMPMYPASSPLIQRLDASGSSLLPIATIPIPSTEYAPPTTFGDTLHLTMPSYQSPTVFDMSGLQRPDEGSQRIFKIDNSNYDLIDGPDPSLLCPHNTSPYSAITACVSGPPSSLPPPADTATSLSSIASPTCTYASSTFPHHDGDDLLSPPDELRSRRFPQQHQREDVSEAINIYETAIPLPFSSWPYCEALWAFEEDSPPSDFFNFNLIPPSPIEFDPLLASLMQSAAGRPC